MEEEGRWPTARRPKEEREAMDSGGFDWMLVAIVGALVLAAAIAFAALRNRSEPRQVRNSEEATRRVYEEEDRAHKGESDNVP